MRIIPIIWFGIQTILGSPNVQGLVKFTIISCKGSPSKNPDLKTSLVAAFSKQLPAQKLPLAVYRCQGSLNDSLYKVDMILPS